ncbi:MAG: hypothetical protein KZQ65_05455 [Candidatus Thiodiazotropha sp. (ex Gloverina cf. vestifex)]|nr:hypothetical protein [Candidatus Thiodiazotropha sp. (ex Gloverina cf. vestifex)]
MNNHETEKTEDSDIPLLEDVVTPEELEIESEYITFEEEAPKDAEAEAEVQVPEYDEVLLSMRDSIAEQLVQDLRPMVAKAVESAITETVGRISQMLHDELDSSLEHRIRCLILEHMEAEFGPREQHMNDDPDR